MKFAAPKDGSPLMIKGRPGEFGYWPVRRSTRRYGVQTTVYSTNPWPFMAQAARQDADASAVASILAFLDQARDFSDAASAAEIGAAKPLLLYYSFLNLAKAYIALRQPKAAHMKAMHGLGERVDTAKSGLQAVSVRAHGRSTVHVNVFAEFQRALTGPGAGSKLDLPVPSLLPQVVVGHRLWCSAASENAERFIGLERVTFMEAKDKRELWLRVYLFSDEVARVARSHKALAQDARMGSSWRFVTCSDELRGRRLSCLEMKSPLRYSGRAADQLAALVTQLRSSLWAVVRTSPPHRRFYLHLAPVHEHPFVLNQLLSIYALSWYFGHLTRYRPTFFRELLESEYGAWIESFMRETPHQFVYLLASDFCRQDITSVGLPA